MWYFSRPSVTLCMSPVMTQASKSSGSGVPLQARTLLPVAPAPSTSLAKYEPDRGLFSISAIVFMPRFYDMWKGRAQ